MFNEECEYYERCANRNCLYCYNHSLFKEKGKKKSSMNNDLFKTHDYKVANQDDSWKDLEQQVANSLNKVPDIKSARRSRASGALFFEKGDVVDSILHPECKERGTEKSFSIKRLWLEKAKEECKNTDKTMCLPFRFKGDENIYCIFDNNDIAGLITMMKAYMQDNDILREENRILKEQINKLKKGE